MREAIHEYLLECPCGASTAELVGLIFTRPGSDPEIGPRVLQSLLGADTRFCFDAEMGRWRIAAQRSLAEPVGEATFVVVDLETTGGGPASGHSIIEIGAVKVAGGRVLETFEALVDPGRRLPPFITRLTGITDEMLNGRGSIEEVLPKFARFAGEHVLVAHNARFDRGFLDAAWRRVLDRPITRSFLCTLRLSRRLLPQLRRRSLGALAGHYGIAEVDRHRALGDARITAEVLFHFLEALPPRGILRVAEALDFQGVASDGRRFFCMLPRSAVAELPRAPGIYRFFGEDRELLYIGKATNLHQRVSSYLSNSKSHSKKTLEMIRRIRSVAVEETGSDLEASLLEAERIRLDQPPFNVLRKHLPRIAYLKLSVADRFPRLSLASKPAARRARYFGPFRSRSHAERALDTLTRAFRLRTCSGRLAPDSDFPPCFQGQIGNCTRPCDETIGESLYTEQVGDFLQFFDRGEDRIFASLAERRERQSDCLRFEAAARLQRDIDLLRHLRSRQQQLSWIVERHHFAVVQPHRESGTFLVYVVVHGRLIGRYSSGDTFDLAGLVDLVGTQLEVANTKRAGTGIRPEEVDGTTILAAWLRDRGESDGYVIPIDAPGPDGDAAIDPEEECAPGRLPEWAAALRTLLATDPDRDTTQRVDAAKAE